ncbi:MULTISPECIES: STAS domain-containing protein [Amycolatopsis]|uniref:STAS domain-containing protein n=1 Tax=Amycolatopsis thermalba TaxID=944492 RepID=A0ABY4NXM5_9PSEU|nr:MULTISPECIES: STAS domain-containing protein [Amycolatopsis]OXM75001.1 anti-anti-sigma factor [Amycolatopsis sp. KNN50.9b]UQS24815.1 STAS domain-containing protein [Amycolatopsis thermalba]
MSRTIEIAVEHASAGCSILRMAGELDRSTVPALIDQGMALLDTGHHYLVLDLSRVTFCDSSGADVFLVLGRTAEERGGSLVLAGFGGLIQRLLERAGLIGVLPTTITVRDAVARFDSAAAEGAGF